MNDSESRLEAAAARILVSIHSNATPVESRILVIDDTVAIHDDFRKILQPPKAVTPALASVHEKLFGADEPAPSSLQFTVDCVAQGPDGLERVVQAIAEGRPYRVAFVDMRMPPGWDGIETTRHLWEADPELQVVICTAHSDHTWDETARELGTTDNLLILKKPFDKIEVLQIAHALASKWLATRCNKERLADLHECVRHQTDELRAAEGRFTRVFSANPVPTTLQALSDGRYADANPAFLDLVGCTYEQIVGHTPAELDLWSDCAAWEQMVVSLVSNAPLRAKPAQLRTRSQRIRDVLVWVEQVEIGGEACVLTSIEDVTERLLLERKYQQAQKMEAVGQLAAGIAHDFNNLLTVIQSYTTLALDDGGLKSDSRECLTQVRGAAARAADLTRQLLIFSRRQISQAELVDLAATFTRLREMLGRLIPEHIRLNWNCPSTLPRMMADEANLEQVVINLVVNARDAMPDGGSISVKVARVWISRAQADRHPGAQAGDGIQITVTDTGSGMSPDVVAHIFEPFFTTKGVGKGTGLGLSTVYAIVRQHAGWVEVASAPAQGTTFDVFLPIAADGAAKQTHRNGDAAPAPTLDGRGERILLVEDEPAVRRAAQMIIGRAGYSVTEAVDAVDALKQWSSATEPFDLLMTDMVMPNGTNGIELATQLRSQHPKLRVIISTGYSQELLQRNGNVVPGTRLLLKPFSSASLLRTIRESLDTND